MSLLYALPSLDYSRALARLFVPGLDARIRSAAAGIRRGLLFSRERRLRRSSADIPLVSSDKRGFIVVARDC